MSKKILVTGTSSGFGKLTALTLAAKGHQIFAAMRNVQGSNAAAAQELNAMPNITVVEMDVTSTESVDHAVQNIIGEQGGIDILVNNAGVGSFGLLEASSIEQMKKTFEVNVWGTMRNILAVLPVMREKKEGLIINISSILGIFGSPYLGAYNGSKWAVEGITETLRYEVREFGIELVTVQPGTFPTGIGHHPEYGPDRPEIASTYGTEALGKFEKFGSIVYQKIEEYQMDPQEVANAISGLIDQEPGKRSHYTVVNRVTNNFEQEYANKKTAYNQEWMKRMGTEEWLK